MQTVYVAQICTDAFTHIVHVYLFEPIDTHAYLLIITIMITILIIIVITRPRTKMIMTCRHVHARPQWNNVSPMKKHNMLTEMISLDLEGHLFGICGRSGDLMQDLFENVLETSGIAISHCH